MKNVILLTIDTLRRDVIGAYESGMNLTPFIDSIQDKCIRFEKSQTIAPYTVASFPGILTSSYCFDYGKSTQLSPKRTLVSQVLKANGIKTAGFHSNPYLCGAFGWNRGWNTFYDSMEDDVTDVSPYIKGDVINRKVDDWFSSHLNNNGQDKNFLWVHYMDVHEPYVPHKKYLDQIDPSINLSEEEMFKLFVDYMLPRDSSNREIVTLLKKLYCAHVLEVDDYTRELFEILNKHCILDDTVVIIATDHGDEFLEHGTLGHDGKFYRELIDSPLMIYNSGINGGQVCNHTVSGVDIPPTILYLFELEPEPNFQGQSLLPVETYKEKECYAEAVGKLSHRIKETDRPAYMCRKGNLKIIYREEDEKWEMYDLDNDPNETNNIVNSSPVVDEMKAMLKPRIISINERKACNA